MVSYAGRDVARWADGAEGRVVTWPDPEAYVLVEGVLLRMSVDAPGPLPPGTGVRVRWDARADLLRAYGTGSGDA